MDNVPIGLAQVMGPMYLVLGISVLLYTKTWHRLLDKFEEDHLPLFTLMLVMGVLGVFSVNQYNEWSWNVWLLVTLTGWCLTLKSLFYFLLPGSLIKKCLSLCKNMGMLYIGGLVGLVFGAVLTYYAYLV